MSKYRVSAYDAPKRTAKTVKPGTLPDNKIPIFDHKGNRRGHVGRLASSATVSRFTGTPSNKLVKKDGGDAWVADKPIKPNTAARSQNAKLAAQLRQDKGSVGTLADVSAMGTTQGAPPPKIGGGNS
jgi:hypothetical protein